MTAPSARPTWVLPVELAVLAIAIAVRVANISLFEATLAARYPMVDAYVYYQQALDMLAGKDPFGEGLYQPPGYPAFLWVVGKLADGLDPGTVRLVQAALGVLTTAGLLVLGRRHGRAWTGPVAGALYALYPVTLLFEQDLLTPALTSFCLVGALVAVWTTAALPWWRGALAGACFGLAVVSHPTYLIAAFVLIAWVGRTRGRVPAAAMAIALGLCLLPTTKRNLDQFGTFSLVSHNAGVNFYLGNNPAWRDTSFLRPGLPFRQLVLEAEPDRRNAPERDAYWRARTWAEIGKHPDAWAAALFTKAYWSVHSTEIPRNEDYRCRTATGEPLALLRLLPVRYAFAFPLAIAGVLGCLRSRERVLLPLLWAALHLPLILFLVADRYRLATWPVVAILAAFGVEWLVWAWQSRAQLAGQRWAQLSLLLVSAAGVLPWLPIDGRTRVDPSVCDYTKGNLAYMHKQYDEARDAYARVVAAHPTDIGAHHWLGQLAVLRDDHAAAFTHFSATLAGYPDHFPTLKAAGTAAEKVGDLSAAIDLYQRAYAVPGERGPTGERLVKALVRAGREDDARAVVAADPSLAERKGVQEALGAD